MKNPFKINKSTAHTPAEVANKLAGLKSNQKVYTAEQMLAADKEKQSAKKKAVGITATRMWGDVFNEEYISDLKGYRAAIKFEEMLRRDYQCGLLETSVMGVIKAAHYSFTIPNLPNGDKHAELCEWQWAHGFNKTSDENLNDLGSHIFFGHALFEPVEYEAYKHPKFGLIWKLKSMGFRDQASITEWNVVGGDLIKVHQQTLYGTPIHDVWMPGENIIVLTEKRKGDNFEGRAMLRLAYGPEWRKNTYYKLLGIGLEKASMGLIIVTVPPNKVGSTEETAFLEAVGNYVAHENAYLKKTGTYNNDKFEGFEVEVITLDFKADAVINAIKLEDTNIAKCGAAAFSELGQGGNGGAYNLGVADIDFFFSMIKGRLKYICEKTQRMWNDLIIYNFGEQHEYPTLKGELTEKAGEELARILNYYYNIGVYTPQPEDEVYLRKRHNLPELKIPAASEPKPEGEEDTPPVPGKGKPGDKPVDEDAEDADGVEDGEGKEDPKAGDADDAADEGDVSGKGDGKGKGKGKLSKQPPAYVKKIAKGINFKAFGSQLETLTEYYNKDVGSALQAVQDKYLVDLANKLKNNPNNPLKAVNEIEFGFTRQLREKIEGNIISSMYAGKKQGKAIMQAKKGNLSMSMSALASIDSFSPDNKKWIKNTATITLSTILDTFKKEALLTAKTKLDAGESDEAVAFGVRQAMDAWKGDANNLGAGAIVPSALDTGRDEAYTDAGLAITGWVYMNDDPKTAICQWLAGRTAQAGDPNIEKRSPPNHWSCESYKIPIMSDEEQPEVWDGWDVPASILDAQTILSNRPGYQIPEHFKFFFKREAA